MANLQPSKDDLRRFAPAMRRVMARTPQVLTQRRLTPKFREWLVTREDETGLTVAFGVLDDDYLVRHTQTPLTAYFRPDVLHDLSTLLDGMPVFPSNTSGMRYAFVLDRGQFGQLPGSVDFPSPLRGQMLIGVTYNHRPVSLVWEKFGHALVAGMTGYGKSTFLRAVVYQAIMEGMQLAVCDVASRTFPMLAASPALIAPIARKLEDVPNVMKAIEDNLRERERLFDQAPCYPDNLDEYNAVARAAGLPLLPRLLVVLDEYNALVMVLGGPKKEFSRQVTTLVMEGRKWGVHVVLAGHEFQREATGSVRGQCQTRLCFRVEDHTTSSIVIGSGAGTTLNTPGQAILRGLGKVQCYRLEKDMLVQLAPARGPQLAPRERAIAEAILARHGGHFNENTLQQIGMNIGPREAARLCREWDARGWTAKDRQRANARFLTPELIALLEQNAETVESVQTNQNP